MFILKGYIYGEENAGITPESSVLGERGWGGRNYIFLRRYIRVLQFDDLLFSSHKVQKFKVKKMSDNPEELPQECRMWLDNKLVENAITLKELIKQFYITFSYMKKVSRLTENSVRLYASYKFPDWEEKTSEDLETAVKEEIEQAEIVGEPIEEFVGAEEGKIDQALKHRRILKEMWENYIRIRQDPKQGIVRNRLLELISKELLILQDLEEREKGILSVLAEIKQKEEEESATDHLDYLLGFGLQTLIRKSKTCPEALKNLELLQTNVETLKKIILKENDIEETIKSFLRKLYSVSEVEKNV